MKLSKNDGYEKIDKRRYRNLVGSSFYLTTTRLDLIYAASLPSRFMNALSQAHYGVHKKVLRYIRGSANFGVWFLGRGC